ncbi:hypothetical protein H920_04094 [Fukomys damarensis]|uniref:Uncharacterized protein n=1 Tax=Fukomys damarensis TaxID=885580 RepID=A0A091DW36_FUKDA|nr:hypothetical protein H920_04094 [Fukomys damarensis]
MAKVESPEEVLARRCGPEEGLKGQWILACGGLSLNRLPSSRVSAPDMSDAISQVPGGSVGPDLPREGEPHLLLTQQPSLKCREEAWALIHRGKENHACSRPTSHRSSAGKVATRVPLNPHNPPHSQTS